MNAAPRPLTLDRARASADGPSWAPGLARWSGAIALHLLPLALLVSALPIKPKDVGGAFGQSVSVTLVSGARSSASEHLAQASRPSLASLEGRLSDTTANVADGNTPSGQLTSTRLSDLFDQAGTGATAPQGPISPSGIDDDPFARASVSYRGDDPAKAARLRSKAQTCARGAGRLRLLLIINSEGYLAARPRALGGREDEKAVARASSAIERCAPFPEAATPGPPRSYEIDLG